MAKERPLQSRSSVLQFHRWKPEFTGDQFKNEGECSQPITRLNPTSYHLPSRFPLITACPPRPLWQTMKRVGPKFFFRMYDRIVIAVDGSDEARRAASRGLELAQAFDADVEVLSVIEQKALRLTETSDEKAQLRERREAALTEIEELASEFGKPVTTKLAEGNPAVRISEYADEQDADLLIVGRQGLTGLGRRLLGGVTEQVLHRSTVPVLVVSGGDDDGEREPDYSRVLITTDGSENAEVAIPYGTAIAQRYSSNVHVLNVVDLQAAAGPFSAGGSKRNSSDGSKREDKRPLTALQPKPRNLPRT